MHVAWWQMASTSPEGHPPLCDEGGKRRTSFSVSCGFHCPHTLPYMSQFLHAYAHIQLSFTNVTLVDLQWIKLNTKYKYNHFMDSSTSSTCCLCSIPYNLSLTLHHQWFSFSNCALTQNLRGEDLRKLFSWRFQLLDPDLWCEDL